MHVEIAAAIFARLPIEVRRLHARMSRSVLRQFLASQIGPATPNKIDAVTRAYVAMIMRHKCNRGPKKQNKRLDWGTHALRKTRVE